MNIKELKGISYNSAYFLCGAIVKFLPRWKGLKIAVIASFTPRNHSIIRAHGPSQKMKLEYDGIPKE